MKNAKSIRALFAFPNFTAASKLVGKFGDQYARVIQPPEAEKRSSINHSDRVTAGIVHCDAEMQAVAFAGLPLRACDRLPDCLR